MEEDVEGEVPYREVAAVYDELVGDTAYECWLENFERLVDSRRITFHSAVDVACGTGQAAVYLAGRCERVYGVDQSPWMLDIARRRTGAHDIEFLEQSFNTLELPERVELLTCNFDSLNYVLEEGELAEAVKRFGRCLLPGGYAMFDLNTTRELAMEWGDSTFVHRVSGAICLWEAHWDPATRINSLHMTNFFELPGGNYHMSEELHRERAYDVELVRELLQSAGFELVEAFDARGLTGVGDDTRRVQFLARL